MYRSVINVTDEGSQSWWLKQKNTKLFWWHQKRPSFYFLFFLRFGVFALSLFFLNISKWHCYFYVNKVPTLHIFYWVNFMFFLLAFSSYTLLRNRFKVQCNEQTRKLDHLRSQTLTRLSKEDTHTRNWHLNAYGDDVLCTALLSKQEQTVDFFFANNGPKWPYLLRILISYCLLSRTVSYFHGVSVYNIPRTYFWANIVTFN